MVNEVKHTIKILDYLSLCKNIQCVTVDPELSDNKNINIKRFLKSLSQPLILLPQLRLLLNKKLSEIITYAGLKWHIYTNIRAKYLYSYLQLTTRKKLVFFSSSLSILRKAIRYLGSFLSKLRTNLKSPKCILYKYVKNFIHLFDIDYIIRYNLKCVHKPSQHSVENLILSIKQKLYHKNKRGYWRVSNCINLLQAVLHAKNMLSLWYMHYSSVLRKSDALKTNKIIDHILYVWQTK